MPIERSPIKTRSHQAEKKQTMQESPASPSDLGPSTSNAPVEPPQTMQHPLPERQTDQQDVPRDRPVERAASVRSIHSVEARIRQRKLEAEESLANIRRDQLELQALLIKKRLAADVATIREETDRDSIIAAAAAEDTDTSHRIDEWLQHSRTRGEPPRGEPREPNMNQPELGHVRYHSPPRRNQDAVEQERYRSSYEETRRHRSPTPGRSRDRGIDRLADVLEKMVRQRAPPRQAQELPIFSGAIGEWLPFKAAMRESTKIHNFSPAENLARMRACLRGEARQAVSALSYAATDPSQIMKTLEQCYGRPEMIIDQALNDMRKLPRLNPNTTAVELNSFAIKLQNIVMTVDSIDERGYLQNPMLARGITEKLTPHLKSRWCDYVEDKGSRSEPEIITISKFLLREAERAMRHTYSTSVTCATTAAKAANNNKNTNANVTHKKGANVYATTDATQRSVECIACGNEHATPSCKKLASMTVPKRWEWAKETRVCFQCLNSKHRRNKCSARKCGTDECREPHHALLHTAKERCATEPVIVQDDVATSASTHLAGTNKQVLLKVCPITLKGLHGIEVNTFALLDEGSTITLIDDEIATMIGARGPVRPLRIHGVTSTQREPESRVVELKLRGRSRSDYHTVRARTVSNLALGSQSIDDGLLDHEHLRELKPEDVCYTDGTPHVLIGADNWHLIVTRKLLTGTKNQPAASLTQLGWIIHGSTPRSVVAQGETVLHVRTAQENTRSRITPPNDELHELVKSHFHLDALGIERKVKPNENEERAMEIFEKTAILKNRHYEVGLPWKFDDVCLPPSYDMALSRLRGIERKLDRCPELREAYAGEISKLVQKGYATQCDEDHGNNPLMWYLPHFAVTNPNKPGKVRIVFDAAAKANGTCLNDMLLDGPDLLKALYGILIRFRMKPVAVVADIKEMFLRVKIRREDSVAQHFLWRGDERKKPPQKYVMQSMIFGARSSPFMAHSVRNKNASMSKGTHALAYRAITENHYMDDWVDSFNDQETAMRVINEVREVHSNAGFEMAGWLSNEPDILSSIPDEDKASAPRELGHNAQGKTLGLIWVPDSDELAFNTNMHRVPDDVKDGTRTPTKREVLAAVMSIYDPLCLLSGYLLEGRYQVRELWRQQVGWDEPIPLENACEFRDWLQDLDSVKTLRLPRCYGELGNVVQRELHVFCDASDQAYACAMYWRYLTDDGSVRIALVAGKAKVAPLKPQSIPRMELQAALIGARLAAEVTKELGEYASPVTFWSDSKTVLHWIRNDAVRYTPFVAHRLAEIAELTKTKQWRWVPSAHNVADDATRRGKTRLKNDDRWFVGPKFLYGPPESWPREEASEPDHEEVLANRAEDEPPLIIMTRFSKMERLVRALGYVLLFIDKCRHRETKLTAHHLKTAELLLLKQAQQESFATDVKYLQKGKNIEKGSRLRTLDPMLDNDGILRLRGRIRAAAIPEERKNPPILCGKHYFTKLLIRREHAENHHAGRETIVNNIRQRYWVLRLRPAVRTTLSECTRCKMHKGRLPAPVKGDLPEARLSAYTRPFSRSGIDCFGPMNVVIGRRREKRWGMLFTCLVTRAILIELLSSLSTDSAIMALRRMAARRGWSEIYFSDNATNFRGSEMELKKAYEEWMPSLRDYALKKRADWRFIDPGAPNQGGAWERMIRTVKDALYVTMKERAPKEEVLLTVLTEIEYTVNSRPLLHVSTDDDDDEALTPNHFLLGSGSAMPITGACDIADKRQWRASQALADMFWRRWVKEYLPTLTPRGETRSKFYENVKVGDLVIIADGLLPRNMWPRGRVVATYPGKDGVVRSVDVKTRGGMFRRPARRLLVLPLGIAS